MALVKRESARGKLPRMLEEVVRVPELGGEVIVRGLFLRDRLNLALEDRAMNSIAAVLASCVLGDDRKPLFSPEEWEAFGSRHDESALALWNKALELSKPPEEATPAASPSEEGVAKND